MTVVVALLGLIFLIIIHELGHMLTAKAFGVRVPEFGVGFGPAVLKRKIGKTVYSFRLVLLGGFVKIAGMNDDAEGPDTYPGKPAWQRALIIFAGPLANIVAAVAILAGALMISGQITGVKPVIDEVEPGTLAQEVGLQPGDRLVAVDGERVQGWRDFTGAVADKRPGQEISITVSRDGTQREFSGRLGSDPQNEDRPLVGVRPVIERTTYGPLEATALAVERTGQVTVALGRFVGQLVTGEQSFYKNVTGPVGIAAVGSASVEGGFFAQLLALISLNLALFNLLPILPLDGGHLLFIAAEKVLGRPVSEQTMGKIAALGIALVVTLFLFATYADLSKIFTGQPFIPE